MAGLREKQKADRRLRILRAAVEHFRDAGYRAVKIEDLAESAEVSVGTVYNYYRTKGDILIATVSMEVEEVIASGKALLRAPPQGAVPALLALTYHYYDHSLHYLTKEMWRTAMALAISAPETPNGRRYNELDRLLCMQVSELIAILQVRRDLRDDIDADALGALWFNNLNAMFAEFVKDDEMSLETLKDRTASQAHQLGALRPQNG